MVEVSAPDHLPAQTTLPRAVVGALASATTFHPYAGEPLVATVDVFAGPRPVAELSLPVGYRGLIKAEVRVQPNGDWPAGQRAFGYAVAANGTVTVEGPPVFGVGSGPQIVAKFADGTPLPTDAKPDEVGLRWLQHDGAVTYFAVGTAADMKAARAALGAVANSPYSQGPGNEQKGGRGGRGGGGMGGGRGGGMGGGRGGGFGR